MLLKAAEDMHALYAAATCYTGSVPYVVVPQMTQTGTSTCITVNMLKTDTDLHYYVCTTMLTGIARLDCKA